MKNNSNQRILYLRADLGTQDLIGGGSVAHTLGVLKGFAAQQVFVVCASTAMHAVVDRLHIPVIKLAMPRAFRVFGFKIQSLLSNIFFYFRLKNVIRAHRINLIYQRYSMLNCLGVALAHAFSIPLYLEFNGSESWMDKHWARNRRLKLAWLVEKIEMLNLRSAARIIVVSQELCDQLLARGIDAQKIYVCPNGVDLELYEQPALPQEGRQFLPAEKVCETFMFGFSGTFGPWHGIEVLAYIIPRIVQADARAHFLLIGDGLLKQELYEALKAADVLERVTFSGMVPIEQMPFYLSRCDAFLCPAQPNRDGSSFFGSPTKLFEYMACAKPIIASRITQIELVLQDLQSDLLVDPRDLAGFVQTALRVMRMSKAEQAQLGNALRARVLAKHTWRTHVQSFM